MTGADGTASDTMLDRSGGKNDSRSSGSFISTSQTNGASTSGFGCLSSIHSPHSFFAACPHQMCPLHHI